MAASAKKETQLRERYLQDNQTQIKFIAGKINSCTERAKQAGFDVVCSASGESLYMFIKNSFVEKQRDYNDHSNHIHYCIGAAQVSITFERDNTVKVSFKKTWPSHSGNKTLNKGDFVMHHYHWYKTKPEYVRDETERKYKLHKISESDISSWVKYVAQA